MAQAVSHAKFVCSDMSSYEVVLMKILQVRMCVSCTLSTCVQVLRELLLSPAGAGLSNESVCEIMQTCFRICFDKNSSEILRRAAEGVLADMVAALFRRLHTFHEHTLLPGDRIRTLLSAPVDEPGDTLGLPPLPAASGSLWTANAIAREDSVPEAASAKPDTVPIGGMERSGTRICAIH